MTPRRRLASVVADVRARGGDAARRALLAVGGRRLIVALGALFLAVGIWQVYWNAARGKPAVDATILFVLIAAPAVGLFYGGARLPRADVHEDFYATIAGWCLGACGVIAVGLALYDLQPDGAIDEPAQSVPVLLAIGCFAGFAAGVHDARARTRARELAHRNRQLERTRRELESTVEQLRSSNERLEQFAYAASHDLQEPLRMVSSYVQLVDRRYGDELDADAEEYLEFAVDGADRMRAMIDALLEYSRVETQGEPLEPVDLEAVLAAVQEDLQLQIDEHDARIEVDPLPVVRGDRDQLRQVFQNLLENAIEYSGDEPPHVTVTAAPEDIEPSRGAGATADDAEDGDAVTVAVRDRGIGIEPEYTERVFDVFERLHGHEEHAGTGIGLALCRRIVDRHGGEIWVDSEPGEGSTFYLTLPAAERPEAPAEAHDAPEQGEQPPADLVEQ